MCLFVGACVLMVVRDVCGVKLWFRILCLVSVCACLCLCPCLCMLCSVYVFVYSVYTCVLVSLRDVCMHIVLFNVFATCV